MINFTSNKISLDTNRLVADLKTQFHHVLIGVSNQLIQIMRQEIPEGNLPGKPEWRSKLESDLAIVSSSMINDIIETQVGAPYMSDTWEYVRGMLIEYGSGSEVGNPPIQSRPGEEVWNDNLDGKHISNAKSSYLLPPAFNQQGSAWIENAMLRVRPLFNETMTNVLKNFDIKKHIIVQRG